MKHKESLLLTDKEMSDKFGFPEEVCRFIRKQVNEKGEDFYVEFKGWDIKDRPCKITITCVNGEWVIDRSL